MTCFIFFRDNTHLAGRDPVSGRKVVNGLGGGVKHKLVVIVWIFEIELTEWFLADFTG